MSSALNGTPSARRAMLSGILARLQMATKTTEMKSFAAAADGNCFDWNGFPAQTPRRCDSGPTPSGRWSRSDCCGGRGHATATKPGRGASRGRPAEDEEENLFGQKLNLPSKYMAAGMMIFVVMKQSISPPTIKKKAISLRLGVEQSSREPKAMAMMTPAALMVFAVSARA